MHSPLAVDLLVAAASGVFIASSGITPPLALVAVPATRASILISA